MSLTMVVPATETPLLRRWWRCANCRAKLGEVVGDSLIIANGRRTWVLPLVGVAVKGRCKCGAENELTPAAARRIEAA